MFQIDLLKSHPRNEAFGSRRGREMRLPDEDIDDFAEIYFAQFPKVQKFSESLHRLPFPDC
jgi:hypothetical protein